MIAMNYHIHLSDYKYSGRCWSGYYNNASGPKKKMTSEKKSQ